MRQAWVTPARLLWWAHVTCVLQPLPPKWHVFCRYSIVITACAKRTGAAACVDVSASQGKASELADVSRARQARPLCACIRSQAYGDRTPLCVCLSGVQALNNLDKDISIVTSSFVDVQGILHILAEVPALTQRRYVTVCMHVCMSECMYVCVCVSQPEQLPSLSDSIPLLECRNSLSA